MNVIPINGAALNTEASDAEAAKRAEQVRILRDFADRFEAGAVKQYVMIATAGQQIETHSCASVFDSIALASLLHDWAVSRMRAP